MKGGVTGEGIRVLEEHVGDMFHKLIERTHEKFDEDLECVISNSINTHNKYVIFIPNPFYKYLLFTIHFHFNYYSHTLRIQSSDYARTKIHFFIKQKQPSRLLLFYPFSSP